jgi:endoglucanase
VAKKVKQTTLPRWRGFNLLDMFTMKDGEGRFREEDFQIISEMGFDFVRLPLCYTLWTKTPAWEDIYSIEEQAVAKIDEAVRLGQKYGIHVNVSFHRGPGYSVNHEREEPYVLWRDQEALDAFQYHWRYFARRYQGIPNSQVSFNLLNEPAREDGILTHASHERVMRATVKAIHEEDPQRLIILDGMVWGNEPIPELADLAHDNVAHSTRAYVPMSVTHYKASWVAESANYPAPQWPGGVQDMRHNPDGTWQTVGRRELEEHYSNWARLAAETGVGVHCGEGGAFNQTPHPVVLSWLDDVLDILTSYQIGYALWNFRGAFGIMDSERADVAYEEYRGHKLDRAMLNVLQKY